MGFAHDDWVDRAKRADIWQVLNQVAPGHRVKLRHMRGVGPCPACGGHDRFSIDRRKGLFNCRKGRGGDVIKMVQYLTGANFLGAVEIITGERAPDGGHAVTADATLAAQRAAARAEETFRLAREENAYRAREIERAARIWADSVPVAGTAAETYLHRRGLTAPAGARLRCHPALKYWQWSAAQKAFVVLHRGPALVARIDDGCHRFLGSHCTYLDLAGRSGKLELADPETGEILPAKKVRGSPRGGHIHLGGDPAKALSLYIGEGTETVLSVYCALLAGGRALDSVLFWSAINLGNLGGPSAGSVPHPTAQRTDSRGRRRAVRVPGPVPRSDGEALMPPTQVTDVCLLGDGDSDHFATELVLRRAARRWAQPGRNIRSAWAPEGHDFNSMRKAEAGA